MKVVRVTRFGDPDVLVAGRVAAIGDGVAPEWPGRRVATGTAGRLGGNAERAVPAHGSRDSSRWAETIQFGASTTSEIFRSAATLASR
jgi:hypothetical protein